MKIWKIILILLCFKWYKKMERISVLLIIIVIVMSSLLVFYNYYEYVKYFSQVFAFMPIFAFIITKAILFSIISSWFLWKDLKQIMIKMLMSYQERLQIIPVAPFIQTSVKSRLVIPTGKYLTIMVRIFIFMGHTLVRFWNQSEKKIDQIS